MQQARQLAHKYLLRLPRNARDDLAGAWDVVDEARVLPHRQRSFIDIAGIARRPELGNRLGTMLPQRPFPSGPALDELVASRARHRARPDQARRNIGNFRKLRVVAVAVDDRLLEIRMPPRSLPCAMMTSAPAFAARTASFTAPAI